jgi:hypothetical protein
MKYGSIGIQLGQRKVKIAQIALDEKQFRVIEMISVPTPEGSLTDGYVKTPRVLGDSIGRAIDSSKFHGNRAMVAIPSEILKIYLLSIPKTANLDRYIASKLSQMAFEHPEDLTFDYKVANTKDTAIVAVTNKRYIAKIREVASEAGLKLIGTDLEMLSIYRHIGKCYRTKKNPIVIALFTPPKLKIAFFTDAILSQLTVTNYLIGGIVKPDKPMLEAFTDSLETFKRNNIITKPPSIFLAGLSYADTDIERFLWTNLGLTTTAIRWSQLYNVSEKYRDIDELIKRFGAYSCSLGLSIADIQINSQFSNPIIPDVRIPDYDPTLYNFPQRIEK